MSPDTVAHLLQTAPDADWEAFCAAVSWDACRTPGQAVALLQRWERAREDEKQRMKEDA